MLLKRTKTGQTRIDTIDMQYLGRSKPAKQRYFHLAWPVKQDALWQMVESFNKVDNDPFLQYKFAMQQIVLFFEPGFDEIEPMVSECSKIFKSIVGKDYYCFSSAVTMNAQHELRLVRPDGSYLSPGAGQSEVLRLAFSLAVRKVSKSKMPMILDSPFLRVRRYASNIIKVLGSLQTQVINMVVDTEVSQMPELGKLVGRRYFIRHDPKIGMSAIE